MDPDLDTHTLYRDTRHSDVDDEGGDVSLAGFSTCPSRAKNGAAQCGVRLSGAVVTSLSVILAVAGCSQPSTTATASTSIR